MVDIVVWILGLPVIILSFVFTVLIMIYVIRDLWRNLKND